MMPSQYRVVVTRRAFDDLNRIFDDIRRSSPANAVRVLDELWAAIQSLREFPQRYTVVQAKRHPAGPVRRMPVPPHVVYYRTSESLRRVRVLTVLHGRQRRPRSFE